MKLCKRVLIPVLVCLLLLPPFAFTGSAAELQPGDLFELGSYPSALVTDDSLTAALAAAAGPVDQWQTASPAFELGYPADGPGEYASDYERYTDVTYKGERYRGYTFSLYKPDRVDEHTNHSYYQRSNGYPCGAVYWFRWQPLTWRVLDGEKRLALCENVIDAQPFTDKVIEKVLSETKLDENMSEQISMYYNDESMTHYATDYVTSYIRRWLNGDFYTSAFTSAEQAHVALTALDNTAVWNPALSCDPTNDRVFLLSLPQAVQYGARKEPPLDEVLRELTNGVSIDPMHDDATRVAAATDYAMARGVCCGHDSGSSGTTYETPSRNTVWLLRSPGRNISRPCVVDMNGEVQNYWVWDIADAFLGTRPAITYKNITRANAHKHKIVSLPAAAPTCTKPGVTAGASCAVCYQTLTEQKELAATGHVFGFGSSVCRCGDAILFGSYPQKQVTDPTTLAALNAKQHKWRSYGYYTGDFSQPHSSADGVEKCTMRPGDCMLCCDETWGGANYRGVKIQSLRPTQTYENSAVEGYENNQSRNGFAAGGVYWFKYQPLVWRILDASEGLLLAENIIDAQPFQNCLFTDEKEKMYEVGDDGMSSVSIGTPISYYTDATKTVYASSYVHSTVRAWLNGSFYNTAFTPAQQKQLVATTVENLTQNEDKSFNEAPVTDKLWLLDVADVWEGGLFSSQYEKSARSTDYAVSQNAQRFDFAQYLEDCSYWGRLPQDSSVIDGCGAWLLRTPSGDSPYNYLVYKDGMATQSIFSDNESVCSTAAGIRPAMRLADLAGYIAANSTETPVLLGDADNDGAVTSADARAVLRAAVGLERFAEDSRDSYACDADRDGTVTAADARLVLRAAVGLEQLSV